MTDTISTWKYVEQWAEDPEAIVQASERSQELGVPVVSTAVGRLLQTVATAIDASTIVEIGTGTGVSGLWLLSASDHSVLTTIDAEIAHQEEAKATFKDAGIASNRTRVIAGKGLPVMEKLAERTYDLVVIDADAEHVGEYVDHALRVARPGGTILVNNVLNGGSVADPVRRDATTTAYRELLTTVLEDASIASTLLPLGNGVLLLVRPLEHDGR